MHPRFTVSLTLSNLTKNIIQKSVNLVHNAFTPVSAKRTLSRPLQAESSRVPTDPPRPPATIPKPAVEKHKRDWPLPVRHYVQRAFAAENSIPGISKQEMEVKLKQIISESVEMNTLLTVDWDSLLLPQQLICKEREKKRKIPETLTSGRDISMLTVQDTNIQSTNTPSKKRKSSDLEPTKNGHESNPPWRSTTNSYNLFEDRISYPEKRPCQGQDIAGKGTSKSHHNLDNRKKRFDEGPPGSLPLQHFPLNKGTSSSSDEEQGPIIGRCQDLEKKYFRLTSAPNPDTVRPLAILEKTLAHLKIKWKKENNYSYICDQFKSLRQDLTVQHIKNDFTVNVYEIHARIALEKGDLGEYNQCQTQLRALYSQNLGGHPTEFKAYRILYFIHTSNRTDMNDVLADLTPAEKNDPAVKHALDTRSALALGNYHRFFQLYLDTPNMGAYLTDMFVNRERLAALSNICKS